MKTIATFSDLASAEMARSILESEGIPALIPDSQMAGLDVRMGTALGGVRLQVAPEYAAAAARLLEPSTPEEVEEESSESQPEESCPFCKSSQVGADNKRKLRALSLLFPPLLLIALPILIRARGRSRCRDCSRTWRPGDTADPR